MPIRESKDALAALIAGGSEAADALVAVGVGASGAAKTPAPPDPPTPSPPPPPPDPPRSNPPLPSAPVAGAVKTYRSQGLTIYPSDENLVDGFIDYLRKRKNQVEIGRKKGFSLFARAGLRALEELRSKDPTAFEALLMRALREQQ